MCKSDTFFFDFEPDNKMNTNIKTRFTYEKEWVAVGIPKNFDISHINDILAMEFESFLRAIVYFVPYLYDEEDSEEDHDLLMHKFIQEYISDEHIDLFREYIMKNLEKISNNYYFIIGTNFGEYLFLSNNMKSARNI